MIKIGRIIAGFFMNLFVPTMLTAVLLIVSVIVAMSIMFGDPPNQKNLPASFENCQFIRSMGNSVYKVKCDG